MVPNRKLSPRPSPRLVSCRGVRVAVVSGALGGVPPRQDARLLSRGPNLHPAENTQRDRSGEGPLDLPEAAGGAGQQA